ncbi:MAG TPA: DNA primase [Candidatus Hydrogenedentes bacterium]|nr:DNA primase [Candidatus Hydrogenedentota bacterium]
MLKYSRDIIEKVLDAVDIVDVIGARLTLKPAGPNRFKALSPFSNERNPSFMVSRDRQIFHCFSSGKGGDAIRFLMEYEGLSFGEALRTLAEQAGIRIASPLTAEDREESLRQELFELNGWVNGRFQQHLSDSKQGIKAQSYLEQRDIPPALIKRFGIGYALPDGNDLIQAARNKQFNLGLLEASGLFRKNPEGWYDFFRDRITFPIRDLNGRVVAFGGRDLSGNSPAKYINTPETPIYRKSKVLYGLYEARDAMRKAGRAVLVEGYVDLIRCHAAGVEYAVATCGTALTEQQAALIRRYVPEIIVVYDGDEAGLKAAVRGAGVLTGAGLKVHALALPDGLDPDDFVRRDGAEAFQALLDTAPDFVTFYANIRKNQLNSPEAKADAARELFEILSGVDNSILVEEYLNRIAEALGLSLWTCREAYRRFMASRNSRGSAVSKPTQTAGRTFSRDDQMFLADLLAYPDLRGEVALELADVEIENPVLANALEWVLEQDESVNNQNSEKLRGAAAAHLDPDALGLVSASMLLDPHDRNLAEPFVRERVRGLKLKYLEKKSRQLTESLRTAERNQDKTRVVELLETIAGTRRQMEELIRASRGGTASTVK